MSDQSSEFAGTPSPHSGSSSNERGVGAGGRLCKNATREATSQCGYSQMGPQGGTVKSCTAGKVKSHWAGTVKSRNAVTPKRVDLRRKNI
jgi:hypothetical protein